MLTAGRCLVCCLAYGWLVVAGACTAVVLIAAHLLGPRYFPEASLLPILVMAWIGLMIGGQVKP